MTVPITSETNPGEWSLGKREKILALIAGGLLGVGIFFQPLLYGAIAVGGIDFALIMRRVKKANNEGQKYVSNVVTSTLGRLIGPNIGNRPR